MLIECLNRRAGGSLIDFPMPDGSLVEYHFTPRADGRHVAEVDDETHVERLLAIPSSFRVAPKPGGKRVEPAPAPPAPVNHVNLEPPPGFPRNLREMNRDQLMDYAKQVQVPGDISELSSDMLALNIQATIELHTSGDLS